MTEEVIEKTISSEDTARPATKSSSAMWIVITMLLLVILIAGAGFYFYQLLQAQGDDINKEDQRNIEISKQISSFQSQLAEMQRQLTEATGSIANADARFEDKLIERSKTQEEKLENTRKELTTAVIQIQRQLGKTRGDWLIADAEYLLIVAGQRLQLVGDINTTRLALEAADERLHESGDAAAIKVREQIAKELAALKAVPEIDLVKIYSQLDSLSERGNQLTLFLPYQGKPVAKSTEHDKHPASSETSSSLLNGVLKNFDNYVVIRHTEQPIKAILTEEQAQFIYQQLKLKLEMVKVALVQKNQNLYHASLQDALTWLDKHFNKNGEMQRFSAELKQLDTIKLNAQMPDISLSLKMLRDITKLRIETDKALPAVELKLKPEQMTVEATKLETQPPESKPVTPAPVPVSESAKPEAKPVVTTPAAEVKPVAAPEAKAEKPVVTTPAPEPKTTTAKPTTAATSNTEVKKTEPTTAKPVNQPEAKPVNNAAVDSSQKTPDATTVKTTPVTNTSADKSTANPAPPASDKAEAKTNSAGKNTEKTAAPSANKPVVVH